MSGASRREWLDCVFKQLPVASTSPLTEPAILELVNWHTVIAFDELPHGRVVNIRLYEAN